MIMIKQLMVLVVEADLLIRDLEEKAKGKN